MDIIVIQGNGNTSSIRTVYHPVQPEATGSGSFNIPAPPHPEDLPRFPNLKDLVLDESNISLFSVLLPILDKYKCLEHPVWKGRRSPWVRAFCDLYHESGPWGAFKFRNVPKMTSSVKHQFKSYRIQKIYEALDCYQGDSEVHKEVYRRLKEFRAKEKYYQQFMDACKKLVEEEMKKSVDDRIAIPDIVTRFQCHRQKICS